MFEMKILLGCKYLIEGYPATVVAIPAQSDFDADYPANVWSDVLATGILVKDDQAGLIHYPDLDDIRIEPLPTFGI
jgi:hypothetical protein